MVEPLWLDAPSCPYKQKSHTCILDFPVYAWSPEPTHVVQEVEDLKIICA